MLNNYYYYYYYSQQSPLSSTNSPTGSRCYPCPVGYYANQTGLAQCTYCPAGSYCPIKTATPIQCPPGSYSDNSTAYIYGDTCLTCPANTYTLSNGSTSCLACPNGKICPDPTRAPITIPLGILILFQRSFDIFDSILVKNCLIQDLKPIQPIKLWCVRLDITLRLLTAFQIVFNVPLDRFALTQVSFKKFLNKKNRIIFLNLKFFPLKLAAKTYTLCPPGYFTGSPGMTACQQCSIGYYATQSGSSSCSQCTPGSYCQDPTKWVKSNY